MGGDQLEATGLLTLISYLMQGRPQVYTPANRPAMGIASFVQAKGRRLGWRGWLYFYVFTDKTEAPSLEQLG